MKNLKDNEMNKEIRKEIRKECLEQDGYRCKICNMQSSFNGEDLNIYLSPSSEPYCVCANCNDVIEHQLNYDAAESLG